MLFKSRAQKMMEALDRACKGPNVQAKDFLRYKELSDEIKAWGAKRPEEFIPFLNEEKAGTIGTWIAGSEERGVALLREVIEKGDAAKKATALKALWEFEEDAASEIPLLTELLAHTDAKVRQNAAHCLGRIGPEAVSAGAKLAHMAQEGNVEEKFSAFFALERAGYDPAILAQICYEEIASASGEARGIALDVLNEIGADANPAFEGALRDLEGDDRFKLRRTALRLLERCDLDDAKRAKTIIALEGFIRSDPVDRWEASKLLWRIDPQNAVVLECVEKGLMSDKPAMESACDVICKMGEKGARFVPMLIGQLGKHEEYWDFCWAAADALGEIGPAAWEAKSVLEKLCVHPSELVQKRASLALGKIAPGVS